MKKLFLSIIRSFFLFPRYFKENGYWRTLKYAYQSEWRIWRSTYFSFLIIPLLTTICIIICSAFWFYIIFDWIMGISKNESLDLFLWLFYWIFLLIYLPFLFSIFFLNTRRFHDFWYSWWWQLCNLLLPIFFFFLVIFVCIFDKWELKENRYWPPPRKE